MEVSDKRISVALEASAGTGKTFQLSMRVASMLINGVPPQDILCLTFTNKAADEMLERIVKVLDETASGRVSESELEILEKAVGKGGENDLRRLAEAARDRLLADFSSLRVKTIDAFSNLILKIFPFEAGLRPDYRICADDEEKDIREEAFYITLSGLLNKPLWRTALEKISTAFEISAASITETLLKYAVFSAARRIELQSSADSAVPEPEEITTLLDKAAELKAKAAEAVRAFACGFNPGILNASQAKVYEKLKNISDINGILGQKILNRQPEEHSYFKKYPFSAEQRKYHSETAEFVKEYLYIKGKAATAISAALGGMLYENLKKIKNDRNILTYSDIGERAYEMLVAGKPHIDKDYLYFRLDGRISHILIDEFQDTSAVQWLILKPLAEEAMAGVGQMDKKGSFFYVGDPKQNLYRFRGGSSGLFRAVAESYEGKLFRHTLPVNYRSDKNIVGFVNRIFKTVASEIKRKELDIFDIDQKPRPGCAEGYVEIGFTDKDNGEDFRGFALRKVREAEKNGWRYGDMAVLVPSNKDGAEIKFALASDGVPVHLETSRSLADTGVFRALTALALFMETGESYPFFEYAFTERHAFTEAKYADESMRHAIMKSTETAAGDRNLTIFERLINVIKHTGFQDRFKNEPDFVQTIDVIAEAAPDEKNIVSFMKAVKKAALSRTSITAGKNDAVTIMTIHKSKGLQFPFVILPKLDIELETSAKGEPFIIKHSGPENVSLEFIHKKDAAPFLNETMREALEEENALVLQDALNRLYVAMTRAEKALVIGVAPPTKNSCDGEAHTVERLLPRFTEIPFSQGSPKAPSVEVAKSAGKNTAVIKPRFYLTEAKKEPPEKTETVNFQASIFGNIFHRAAFLLDGFTDKAAEIAMEQALSCDGAFIGNADKAEITNYLKKLAKSTQWRELFNGSVFRERKVGVGNALYTIDFYSVFKEKIVLLDYKTGEISPEREKTYIEQLKKYESILKDIYGLPVEKYLYCFGKNRLEIKKY